jgi:hypothetical protein
MQISRIEKGQALILFVFAVVALLGFTSLAIDGGMAYAERRHAQNAADTAAMAGALAKINEDANWDDIALAVATKNGYSNNEQISVQVSEPATNLVKVVITAPVDTVLVHFVYPGIVQNTVEAIVDVTAASFGSVFGGNALVGLNPHACDTVRAGGTSGTEIIGGGVFVNSDHPECAFRRHGAGDFVADGSIDVVGGWKNDGVKTVSPTPTTGVDPVPYPPDPDLDYAGIKNICDSLGLAKLDEEDESRLLPGHFSGDKFPPLGVTNFGASDSTDPQIFCINVTDKFQLAANDYEGHNVLFYMMNGNVEWNATANIILNPSSSGDYAGFLLVMDPHEYIDPPNTYVTINGSAEYSRVSGTIWGPASHCKLNGTGDATNYEGLQVVCYNIELLGNARLYITYDEDSTGKIETKPKLSLDK